MANMGLMQCAGPQSNLLHSDVLPPANIHKVLHSLLQGPLENAPVPLLAGKQLPCVQRTCDMLELYSMLHETNAACSQILFQSAVSTPADPRSASAESSGNKVRPDSAKAELASAAIQEGAQKLVLAMVGQVGLALKAIWNIGLYLTSEPDLKA